MMGSIEAKCGTHTKFACDNCDPNSDCVWLDWLKQILNVGQ